MAALRYGFEVTSTGTQTHVIQPFAGGVRIWFRARSNPSFVSSFVNAKRPSQPSSWAYPPLTLYVDTTAGSNIATVTATAIDSMSAQITWTGGIDTRSVQILLRAGTATSSWLTSEVVATVVHPPRTATINNLAATTVYTVAVRELDWQGGFGTAVAATFTTSATSTLTRPAGIDFVQQSSIIIRIYPSNTLYETELEHAPDDGSGGVGNYGAPDTASSTVYALAFEIVFYNPQTPDNSWHWYRARHTSGGQFSGWTPWRVTRAYVGSITA